ncbi:MAG: WecB/TagA/CpsF family glycosyltransferase [Actinobacteria bacterium]|nr:WecB/TagA/CpsF family glycosyltransferase [Actinomycetota bacterium]
MTVGAVAVDLVDRDHAVALVLGSLSEADPLAVVSANLDHIHHFAHDESWARRAPALPSEGAAEGLRWLTLLDGVPLVRTANARSGRDWPKLSGSDLIVTLLESAADVGAKVGFLGGASLTHRELRARLADTMPSLRIAGTWAPARSELTDPAASRRIAAEIHAAGVEILVVALGKPLQEQWIARFGVATGARVLLAFGAVVDFLAGRVRRAPQRVADAGAEWAWRLMLEPRRLGRRYLIHGPPSLVQLRRSAKVVRGVAPPDSGLDRGKFAAREVHADVAAVVVTYNSASDIATLIDDLRVAAHGMALRLIVVDNQSADETVDRVREHGDVVLIESEGNLGYGGGLNAGLQAVGDCNAVVMLNPDLRVDQGSIGLMHSALVDGTIGAVVPLMVEEDGATYPSLRREPSLIRALGDALLGDRISVRPSFTSEVEMRSSSYLSAHDVDWATGAALMMPASVVREVGDWWDDYPIYSEETDYFRRIRETGRRIRFEPAAVVRHRGGGSGASVGLAALMAVNRVRYVERYHSRVYAALFRAVVALGESLRSYDVAHRYSMSVVVNKRRWQELPRISKPEARQELSGQRARGSVIVPACNEAAVIRRTLEPLSEAAADGYIELIVVCNGCTDDTAAIARAVPGVSVVELQHGSKPAALNAGDEAATLWPRLYLDADIQITASAVVAVLDRLGQGDVLAARPDHTYDCSGADAVVRSYYRARQRIPQHKRAMWGAGAYGLSSEGHHRLGTFPALTGDDLYVDSLFHADEKTVVPTEPSVVKTPANVGSLVKILRRAYRGGIELRGDDAGHRHGQNTGARTAFAVVRGVRGPRSAADAAVYLAMALAARRQVGDHPRWERDETSRVRT